MALDWFYAENGQPVGPLSTDQIATKLRLDVTQSFLLWSEGMADWQNAESIPEFKSVYSRIPPPLPLDPQNKNIRYSESFYIPAICEARSPLQGDLVPQRSYAWRRFFARTFDYYYFNMVATFGVALLFPEFTKLLYEIRNPYILNFLLLIVYIPIEAFTLYAFGSTLGKLVYDIRIQKSDKRIDFGDAALRSMYVWWRGMAAGIPLVSLFTLSKAYSQLRKNGTTSWDRDLDWRCHIQEIGLLKWCSIAVCWAIPILIIWIANGFSY